MTYAELHEKLADLDELTLLEVLQINSSDLVLRFDDRIDEMFDRLCADFEEDSDVDSDQKG